MFPYKVCPMLKNESCFYLDMNNNCYLKNACHVLEAVLTISGFHKG